MEPAYRIEDMALTLQRIWRRIVATRNPELHRVYVRLHGVKAAFEDEYNEQYASDDCEYTALQETYDDMRAGR